MIHILLALFLAAIVCLLRAHVSCWTWWSVIWWMRTLWSIIGSRLCPHSCLAPPPSSPSRDRHWRLSLVHGCWQRIQVSDIVLHYYGACARVIYVLNLRSRSIWVRFLQRWLCIKAVGKFWTHTAYVHPTVMGTRWIEALIVCEWLQLHRIRFIISKGDKTVKVNSNTWE